MILVTVGTEKFPFDRLMQWVEELRQTAYISPEEKIIVQYGSSTYIPQGTDSYQLLPQIEFEQLLSQARLVIAHCGEGTIDLLAKLNVPFILVPRMYQFGEHVDDHQVELAEALSQQGLMIAKTKKDLQQFLTNPALQPIKFSPSDYYAQASVLIEQDFINNLAASKSESKLKIGFLQTLQNFLPKKPALSH